MKIKTENIKQATIFAMIAILISRILGFVREMLIAKIYGVSYITDAYVAAFTIPDVMYYLLVGGAISSGFMPVFISERTKGNEKEAWKAANTFISVSLILLLIFNILGIIFSPNLIPFVANGLTKNPEAFDLTVKLTRIMFTAVSFTVLAGIFGGILNSYNLFRVTYLGPILYNVGIIGGAVLLSDKFGIYGVAIGVVVGAMMNFGIMIPKFMKIGDKFKFEFDIKHPFYIKMIKLMIPAIIGLSFSQINLVVNQNMASVLSAGTITALRYANRVLLLPLGIFASSIATTIFPTLNMLIASEEYDKYKKTLFLGLRTILFITIPSAIGMIILSEPIIRVLFRSGKFTEQDVKITAYALACYSIAVIGQSLVQIITRSYYSLQDTKTPIIVGFITVIINIALNFWFVKYSSLAVGGIALSYSITSILNAIILYHILGKKLKGYKTNEINITSIKSLVAAIVMGGVALFVSTNVERFLDISLKINQVIDAGLSIAIGGCAYLIVASALKMEEMDYFWKMVRKKVGK